MPAKAKETFKTVAEILELSIIEGNKLILPDGLLDYKGEYTPVKDALEGIGGKWVGGKYNGFKFEENPEEMVKALIAGDKINLKKDFQFFATPEALADELANLVHHEAGDKILEPSAGRGALVKAVFRASGYRVKFIDCCELMEQNQKHLDKIDGVKLIGTDFLQLKGKDNYYDTVIANPPFTGGQDIEHIRKMYEVCKDGGVVITLAAHSYRFNNAKKYKEFRDWLASVKAYEREIPAGAFKESGTNIPTMLIVIDVVKEAAKLDKNILIDLF